jgi:hypothetical protein
LRSAEFEGQRTRKATCPRQIALSKSVRTRGSAERNGRSCIEPRPGM